MALPQGTGWVGAAGLAPYQSSQRGTNQSRSSIRAKESRAGPAHTVQEGKPDDEGQEVGEVDPVEGDAGEVVAGRSAQPQPRHVGSSRLRQWARVRRKVRSPAQLDEEGGYATAPHPSRSQAPMAAAPLSAEIEDRAAGGTPREDSAGAEGLKEIYLVSDGTGWTADHAVQAALGQFDYCFVDGRCPVKTRLYSQVRDEEKLLEILRSAGENRALVVYTLVEAGMSEVARTACRLMQVRYVDMMGPLVRSVEQHLGVTASRKPRGSPGRRRQLSKEYFRRIEAVDFTIKQDDGAHPRNLIKADIVLVGVSRTGKTPLSIYLAQKGYKVANVPLVFPVPPPPELFEVDQSRIFALTIDPYTLEAIRRARFNTLGLVPPPLGAGATPRASPPPAAPDVAALQAKSLLHERREGGDEHAASARWAPGLGVRMAGAGMGSRNPARYYSLGSIREELGQVHALFRTNPLWPVIDVTGKAIEETAAEILKIHYERIHRMSMPYITRRY